MVQLTEMRKPSQGRKHKGITFFIKRHTKSVIKSYRVTINCYKDNIKNSQRRIQNVFDLI